MIGMSNQPMVCPKCKSRNMYAICYGACVVASECGDCDWTNDKSKEEKENNDD